MECPFCNINYFVIENTYAYAVCDKYPVTRGHLLIIPRQHINNYFDISIETRDALWDLVRVAKEYLQKEYNPDGYNIGINCGESAGQTIPHVHIHLIPRYKGDIENPRGGVRGVIPKKRVYPL